MQAKRMKHLTLVPISAFFCVPAKREVCSYDLVSTRGFYDGLTRRTRGRWLLVWTLNNELTLKKLFTLLVIIATDNGKNLVHAACANNQ